MQTVPWKAQAERRQAVRAVAVYLSVTVLAADATATVLLVQILGATVLLPPVMLVGTWPTKRVAGAMLIMATY